MNKIKPWYQYNWNPQFTCEFQDIIGYNPGKGGKWVCDVHRLTERECLVVNIYGAGSPTSNFVFEKALKRRAPNCEIHVVIHPTIEDKPNGIDVKTHVYELGPSHEPLGVNVKSLQQLMEALHRSDSRIDLLQLDMNGKEWEMYKDVLALDVRQLIVNTHMLHQNTNDFFQKFRDAGYFITSKEANLENAGGRDLDFTYIKLNITDR